MSLIKSISGIRGTIGGTIGDNLTPLDIVKFASAYGSWIKSKKQGSCKVVIGRDARISGKIVSDLVSSTLQALGIDVLDLGLSTTPTVEVLVPHLEADGGIILTASHNPKQWNALKLLNEKGEFISGDEGKLILELAESNELIFAEVDDLGKYKQIDDAISIHIEKTFALPLVDVSLVASKKFKVVVDCVNSTGGISLVPMLKRMGCEVVEMYCEPNGQFPHNPEPLAEHLGEIMKRVPQENADLGIVVDPDVDRLAFVNEDGTLFGEEYTLVAVADYILQNQLGSSVSNLSSSRALREVANRHNQEYFASAVGEVNVVEKMKETNAVIGGEGNGGIIYPELHYGRDSLVGAALFLTFMAKSEKSCKEIRESYPPFFMSKKKIQLTPQVDVDAILKALENKYKDENCTTIDGLKIDFPTNWIHFRKSNTEPIVRIYTEAPTQKEADALADNFIEEVSNMI
ncbi:MAG: phosphoglucosamine mutase [Flavobacteriales bacterium]|nr:phosphoglucosamine mutase [Flavobacteriales bacterium]